MSLTKLKQLTSMKKLLLVSLALSLLFPTLSFASTKVSGYTKKNGTYVSPSYKTAPNKTKLDNYSTKGNYNPYSGKFGKVKAY